MNASDVAMLAALIQCEAGGESYEGKLAVGSVVMNRVDSSYFPDTVVGVIYQTIIIWNNLIFGALRC